jgi:hypothetical protein
LENAIPARLTPKEGRRFGLTVGAAFLVLCAVLWWRNHQAAMLATALIGAGLIIGGVAIPGRLSPVYRAWMGLAHLLSKVTTPIFMGIVYFLVLTPVGLLLRVTRRRPLSRRHATSGYWVDRSEDTRQSGSMERQF